MVYADLHVHTDCSDGQLSLGAVPAAARRAGVEVVAVTDHDRIHPGMDAPVVEAVPPADGDGGDELLAVDGEGSEELPAAGGEGTGATGGRDAGGSPARGSGGDPVTVVRGIELRVEYPGGRVDLLGYGVESTDELSATVDRVQENRKERGRAIVECVEDRLGVDLGVEPRRGLGRPHVARAIDAHPEADYDYGEAFEHLIGDDGPCYVAREIPDFETGRRVLGEACGLVGLAHPLRYADPAAALSLTADLDAVELYYPYGREVDLAPVREAIEDHGLVATGGSDAHGDELGVAGLDREGYAPVRAALG